jgi:hypothetical protein
MSIKQLPLQKERLHEEIQALRSELGGWAIDTTERTREVIGQAPTDRWAKLAAAGVALITLMIIVRRVRRS